MQEITQAKRPGAVRTALLLISALILYRAFLVQQAVYEQVAGLASSESLAELMFTAGELPGGPLVPGSFGNPLLFLVLIPLLVVLRKLIRRGFQLAAASYIVYLGLRTVLILARGPWNQHTFGILFLTLGITILLLTPSTRAWFAECARCRDLRRDQLPR